MLNNKKMVKRLGAGLVSLSALAMLSVATPEVTYAHNGKSNGYSQGMNYSAEILSLIRKARRNAYNDASTLFNGESLKEYVTKQGLSRDQYVNGIAYTSSNQNIAYERATATAKHGMMGHFNADGTEFIFNGGWRENLAWGANATPEYSFGLWVTNEIEHLKAANGNLNSENAHLHQILDPANTTFGFGKVKGRSGGEVSTLVISKEAVSYTPAESSAPEVSPAVNGEAPTAENDTPEFSPDVNNEASTAENATPKFSPEVNITTPVASAQTAAKNTVDENNRSADTSESTKSPTENAKSVSTTPNAEKEASQPTAPVDTTDVASENNPQSTPAVDQPTPTGKNNQPAEGKKSDNTITEANTDVAEETNDTTNAMSKDNGQATASSLASDQQATLVFNLGNGQKDVRNIKIGDMILVPEAPKREGYRFLYWKGSKYYPGDLYKVTSTSKTLTAVYEKVVAVNDIKETKNQKAKQKQLPNTGMESNSLLFNGAALSILVGMGMVSISKKEN